MIYVQFAVQILSALAIIIPLGAKLYQTIVDLTREKNWPKLVSAAITYMAQAETMMTNGADRKTWVLAMVQNTADQINYNLTPADIKNLSDLIDSICDMSRVVNVEVESEAE